MYATVVTCCSINLGGVMDLLGMHDTDGPFQGQSDQLKSNHGSLHWFPVVFLQGFSMLMQ